MKLKKLILIALLSLLTATQAWAQATIYENTFPDAESVDDWTLNGVTWSSANGNSLQFGNSSAYAIKPVLDADRMTITITAVWGSYVILHTSPDGVNYTNQGYFTGSSASSTSSKTMPDGTRYVKLMPRDASGDIYLQSVKITAYCTEIVPASGVTLNKTATTIAVGATEQLTATVLGTTPTSCVLNRNVTWSSSNENVATVSATGLVTAVMGLFGLQATITATTQDGGITAQCQVTTSAGGTPVNALSTNLNDWYSERADIATMQFTTGGRKYCVDGDYTRYSYGESMLSNSFQHNINNDNATDFYSYSYNRVANPVTYTPAGMSNPQIHVASENGEANTIKLIEGYSGIDVLIPADYNSDGLPDFVVGENVFVQGADGLFLRKKVNIEGTLQNGDFVNGGSSRFVSGLTEIWQHISSKGVITYTPPKRTNVLDIDIDSDGLPDLLDTETGNVWLNKGGERYERGRIGGLMFFRDLNGDGVLDYVLFNGDTKTASTHIFDFEGNETSQELISNFTLDNQIWVYDYDNDGDVDIILPFSYSTTIGGSFLAIFANDGNGTFTQKPEDFFTERLMFETCADLDNDGYYDILARKQQTTSPYNATDVVWLKGNAQYGFVLQPTPLYQQTLNIASAEVADINNDGKYELLVDGNNRDGRSYTTGIYDLDDITRSVCAAPNTPAAPEFAYEASTGYLKVSWQQGTDPRYSGVDLTYELRIGTAPGKGDIVYANAYADGRRRNLKDGKQNYALTWLFDASNWNAGDYYISIQAINPLKRGSAFSPETVFTKSMPTANFYITTLDVATTLDTITVMLPTRRDPALEYIWNFDGGTVVDSNAEGTELKVIYTTQGVKKITLQTRNAQGEVSPVCEKETNYLFANKFTFLNNSFYDNGYASPVAFADLDNNGTLEALTTKGVYQNDGLGSYSKIGRLWNTNLQLAALTLNDYNNDGLADIFNYDMGVYTNTSTANNITFPNPPGENLNHTYIFISDFHNDGKADACTYSSLQSELMLNNGDYKNFTQTGFDALDYEAIDFNRDGFLDMIAYKRDAETILCYVSIFTNNGDGTFAPEQRISTEQGGYGMGDYIASYIDFNNDGYVDILTRTDYGYSPDKGNWYIYLNNQNQSFELAKTINIAELTKVAGGTPSFHYAYDFDNNGYLDITCGGILYFYEDLHIEYMDVSKVSTPPIEFGILADMDGDGVQDLTNSNYAVVKNNSKAINTAPAAPANVRYTQTDNTLLIEWDAAIDAESPAAMMRYNISVKKQGATGADAYIISPLNNTQNGVPAISISRNSYNPFYRTATRFEIPLTSLDAGQNYEIQIQALDGWNVTSEFSAPVVANVENNPQIAAPSSICAGTAAAIAYKGTGTPDQRTWNWDGGTLMSTSGNIYHVEWAASGTKNISVTVGGVTSDAAIFVLDAIEGPEIPTNMVAGATVEIPLPSSQATYTMDYLSDVKWTTDVTTGKAKLTIAKAGEYKLDFTAETPCGVKEFVYYVNVVSVPQPVISLVTANNGKSNISWEVPADLPDIVTGVNIYKEGSRYNDFQLIASIPVSETSYIDANSNINVMTSRYRIAYVTADGAESTPSTPHKGIHLMINKGVGNGWNLFWGQYEGAAIESYRILRGTTAENVEYLAEVAGSTGSYTDLAAPAGDVYYAVEYSVPQPQLRAKSMLRAAAADGAGRSNVVFAGDAFNVLLATGLTINAQYDILTPSHPNGILTANIMPFAATLKGVNWTIESGGEWATINENGLMTITGAGNGEVVVKAATIDGSNKSATKTITVSGVVAGCTEYTVTFNSNGGSAIAPNTQQVCGGETVIQPGDPTRENFTFAGWTLNGSTFNFNAPITENITLVAQWEPVGAENTVLNVTVPAGTNAVYVCGTFNNWSQFVPMTKITGTTYTTTLPNVDAIEYKYSSGADWRYVEVQANGEDTQNRALAAGGTANDVVARWKEVYDNTGINEVLASQITIYPNPIKDVLTIESGELKIKDVEVTDLAGRKVIFNSQLSTFNSIDVSALTQGVFLVKIHTDKGIVTSKIVKK